MLLNHKHRRSPSELTAGAGAGAGGGGGLLEQPSVVPVAGNDIVGSMIVQAALYPGLAKCVHHLLDFTEAQCNEVYLQPVERWPQLIGRSFGDVQLMFGLLRR